MAATALHFAWSCNAESPWCFCRAGVIYLDAPVFGWLVELCRGSDFMGAEVERFGHISEF